MWINSDPERQIIEVRKHRLPTDIDGCIAIDDLMDEIESFTQDASDDNMVHLGEVSALYLFETRYETDEELSDRLETARTHALSVQRKADKSWERQKRKFQRARKGKNK